jgi:hypothetical protein
MKRRLQIVALAVMAILAAQPVLAGFTCTMGIGSGAPHCSMAMHMGMACHPAERSAGLNFPRESCRNCSLQDAAQLSAAARPKAGSASTLPAAFHGVPTPAAAFASRPLGPPARSAPDRCILFQVFRI